MQRVVVGQEDKAGPENLFFLKEGGEKNGQPADETAARCCGSPPRRKKCLCVWQAAAEDGVKLVISDCGGRRMTASARSFGGFFFPRWFHRRGTRSSAMRSLAGLSLAGAKSAATRWQIWGDTCSRPLRAGTLGVFQALALVLLFKK